MNAKQLAKFKKTILKLSVNEQIERLHHELKKKQDNDLFKFLQAILKDNEFKSDEKPEAKIKVIKDEFNTRNIESSLKPSDEASLENKIAAEKPAFNVEEVKYLAKPVEGYMASSKYQMTEQEKKDFDAKEATKSTSEKTMEQMESYKGFSSKEATMTFSEQLTKNTEKYKRKEK